MKKVGCNKRSVMKAAWANKKGRFGGMYTFAKCLKLAWKEEKRQVARSNEAYARRFGLLKKIEIPTRTLTIAVDPYKNNINRYYTGD